MLFGSESRDPSFDRSLNSLAARSLTGGLRPGRARRRWSRSHPFPFPLPGSTIGEQKAKVKTFFSFPFFFSSFPGHHQTVFAIFLAHVLLTECAQQRLWQQRGVRAKSQQTSTTVCSGEGMVFRCAKRTSVS